ncbi:hypothetical protein [Enterococcus avium]|uniref:hypothetical protein n=1 Tax=Enterococcus avium TaxID=33945 RepID=UPI0034D1E770
MTIQLWIGFLGIIGLLSLISFLYFFMKDSRLRVIVEKKSTVLLVDCGLLFITLVSIAAAIMLYLNWQEQLNYFMNR